MYQPAVDNLPKIEISKSCCIDHNTVEIAAEAWVFLIYLFSQFFIGAACTSTLETTCAFASQT